MVLGAERDRVMYRITQTEAEKQSRSSVTDTERSLLKAEVQPGFVMPALHLLTTTQKANNGNEPNWPLAWEIDLYWLLLPLHRPTEAVSRVTQVWESLYGHG